MKNAWAIARRKLLKFSAVALGTGLFTQILRHSFKAIEATAENVTSNGIKTDLTPDEAVKLLLEGNQRFVANKRQCPNQNLARLREVAEGQNPFACILSCADSRVPVEILFDQGLGDLFVVRDAGNIATPEEIGSLEYGTAILESKLIMVLGHQKCGAVTAAVSGKPVPGQIGSIIAAIQPAIDKVDRNTETSLAEIIKHNVLRQIEILGSSPVLSQLIQEDKLKIVGGYYELNTGEVTLIT